MIYKNIDLHASVFCNVSEDMAKEYIDYRIKKKKPLTQGAFNRAVNQAAKCTCTPDEAIEITIDKGWDGVTPEYIAAELSRRFEAVAQVFVKQNTVQRISDQTGKPRSTRDVSIIEGLTDRSWAD
jgi:hypothetical protein